jgi:hypothetical protein
MLADFIGQHDFTTFFSVLVFDELYRSFAHTSQLNFEQLLTARKQIANILRAKVTHHSRPFSPFRPLTTPSHSSLQTAFHCGRWLSSSSSNSRRSRANVIGDFVQCAAAFANAEEQRSLSCPEKDCSIGTAQPRRS